MAAIGNGGVGKLLTDKNVFHQKKHLFCVILSNKTPPLPFVLSSLFRIYPLCNRNCFTFSRPISGFGQKLENLLPWKDRYFGDIEVKKTKREEKGRCVSYQTTHHGLPYIFSLLKKLNRLVPPLETKKVTKRRTDNAATTSFDDHSNPFPNLKEKSIQQEATF